MSVRVTSSSATNIFSQQILAQKQDEIEQELADEERADSNRGNHKCTAWPMFQCLGGRLGSIGAPTCSILAAADACG
jgi:hypothetical protein